MASDSRAFRLKLLLAIDTAFLFLELGVGTAVGSLALVADSFHILLVAMQAMKLAESGSASAKYSYGWQRAEVLGALINSVFLLALCFSIGMEAIARFISAVEVTNPQLIVAVGSAGLLSNIVGLFLFHGHGGHSHGGGGGGHSHGGGGGHGHGTDVESRKPKKAKHSHANANDNSEASERTSLLAPAASSSSSTQIAESTTPSESGFNDDDDDEERAENELYVHPGELRENIVKQAHDAGYGTHGHSHAGKTKKGDHAHGDHSGHSHDAGHGGADDDDEHLGGESGEDGSMNMRGVFLHVLGDALGNVGVIAAGLFIWLTDYEWRMYSDPLISLIITCIIFSSALPLAKSASFILLQGVPSSVPLDRLRSAIAAVPGVLNVHELHVWSLSESKTVASVHVMTASDHFVECSSKIRRVMHRYGVHSSTIQPEIVEPKSADLPAHISSTDAANIALEQDGCRVLCAEDSCRESSCCPPGASPPK